MCDDGTTYWQIQHKQDPKRNVWVSGVKGLCDTQEMAMKLAKSCKECLEGEWEIINCHTYEEWSRNHHNMKLDDIDLPKHIS